MKEFFKEKKFNLHDPKSIIAILVFCGLVILGVIGLTFIGASIENFKQFLLVFSGVLIIMLIYTIILLLVSFTLFKTFKYSEVLSDIAKHGDTYKLTKSQMATILQLSEKFEKKDR